VVKLADLFVVVCTTAGTYPVRILEIGAHIAPGGGGWFLRSGDDDPHPAVARAKEAVSCVYVAIFGEEEDV